jgi:hypothetical protein
VNEEEKKFFSVNEAETLIPKLEGMMGRLMGLHSEAGRVRGLFQEEQRKIMFDGGRRINVAELGDLKGRLEGLTTELRSGINELQAMGAIPKDLGQGLVDFPCLLGDEEVNLCWRFGEKHIRFWHGLDEGFAGRKGLPER